MAQATLSCPCGAIHLETPFLGFFRNYLPSRIYTCCRFLDSLAGPRPLCGRGRFCSSKNSVRGDHFFSSAAMYSLMASITRSIWGLVPMEMRTQAASMGL